MKPTSDFSTTLFIGFIFYAYSHNKKNPLFYTVLRIYDKQQ